ncbi:hypothetical protein, partial [Salmonella sp. s54836]|uniref:hypothetical protein n=1 Tax=Salmonella sp. s54836 TaxID=3159673 RepID=UPI00397FBDCB
FFQGFDLTVDSVKIQCNDVGFPNGKAYVNFPSFSQAMLAIETYNGKFIGGISRVSLALV